MPTTLTPPFAPRPGRSARWLTFAAFIFLGACPSPATAQLIKGLEPEPAPKPSATQATPATLPLPPGVTANGADAETADLRRDIESLTTSLTSTAGLTLTTIVPLADLAAAEQRAAEYRRRLNTMRAQMYLPDPRPDSRVTQALTALQDRWGELVRPVLDGEPPARLAADQWSRHAAQLDTLYCDRVPKRAPAEGMPLVGWAWACLADQFFRELGELEFGVLGELTERRRTLTAPAESALRKAEDALAELKRVIAHAPSPALLLRNVTWLLFEAWREIAGLRVRELQAQQRFRGTTAAFQWLLEFSPVVRRREHGSEAPIAIAAGGVLSVSIGGDVARGSVATSDRTNLARELHRLHYRLVLTRSQPDAGDERSGLEVRRARTLQSIAVQAR